MSGSHRRHARGRSGHGDTGRGGWVNDTGPQPTVPSHPPDDWGAPGHHRTGQDAWSDSWSDAGSDAWSTPADQNPWAGTAFQDDWGAPPAHEARGPRTDAVRPDAPYAPDAPHAPDAPFVRDATYVHDAAAAPAAGKKSRMPKLPRAPKVPGGAPKNDLATEITASLVVFLVALPLCIGVAVASGVPPELGIISGVIGGLVVGAARGSTLQVSGPAAGLAALVSETVLEHGVAMLGVIVLFSGILQIVLGLVRFGRFFQAISLAVVQGMLAGIGLPLMFSQAYPVADAKAPGTPIENMAGIPGLLADTVANPQTMIAAALGILTVVLSFLWKKVPGPVKKVPAALIAVGIGIAVAALPGVDVKTLQVGNLLASVDVPGPDQFAGLADAGIITAILTFTVIASAESLFTAAAVDRMHDGPRTRYNPELIAQGAGNTVAGLLGALPVTAVVARSSANVQAGAKTRMSRTLHGLWLLAFALLLPQVLALIPISVLAGVLVHSGWKLFAPEQFPKMWRQDRGEFAVMTITTLVIVATALLEGVLIGLAAGIVLAALRMSQTVIKQHVEEDTAKVVMAGNATFLRLPQVIEALEAAAESGRPRIRLDLTGVTHLDHACRSQVEEFTAQQRGKGVRVELLMPGPAKATATAADVPGQGNGPLPQRPATPPTDTGPVPGPTAEWFYLDTRPMPDEYADQYVSR